MTQHNKSQIQELLDSNPAFIGEAIRILGANQTDDELAHKPQIVTMISDSQPHMRVQAHVFLNSSLVLLPRPGS